MKALERNSAQCIKRAYIALNLKSVKQNKKISVIIKLTLTFLVTLNCCHILW